MDDTAKTFHRVLSVVGIPIYAKRNWDSKIWLLLQLPNFFIGVLTILFQSCYLVFNASNLLIFIKSACEWTTGLVMFIMLAMCLFLKKNFRNFLDKVFFKDFILEMPLVEKSLCLKLEGGKIAELRELVTSSQMNLFNYTRILLKSYVAAVWLCTTLYICGPIYTMFTTKKENLRLLAFDMWFPWGLENFHVYAASFTFHMYAGYLCCIVYPGLQLTIVYPVCQIIRQLRILTFILTHLHELTLEICDGKEKWQPVCTQILNQCIIHFIKLKRLSNQLNKTCQLFYLTFLVVAVMLFCMCSVKIAISDKLSYDITKYYIQLTCYILMVLMFCTAGQQVQNECDKLEMAITDKWYIYDARHIHNIRIFKMALSQSMPIYIFGSLTLSLPTFTMFIRSGTSFFALVMSFLEE